MFFSSCELCIGLVWFPKKKNPQNSWATIHHTKQDSKRFTLRSLCNDFDASGSLCLGFQLLPSKPEPLEILLTLAIGLQKLFHLQGGAPFFLVFLSTTTILRFLGDFLDELLKDQLVGLRCVSWEDLAKLQTSPGEDPVGLSRCWSDGSCGVLNSWGFLC